jgi:hypothetical protein
MESPSYSHLISSEKLGLDLIKESQIFILFLKVSPLIEISYKFKYPSVPVVAKNLPVGSMDAFLTL